MWEKGAPFAFSDKVTDFWRNAVRIVLSEMGYSSAEIELQIVRDEETGTVDLVAEVGNLNEFVVLGKITIEGAKINSKEATLQFLGLEPGTRLTKSLLEHAELKLIESGRYLAHRFVLRPQSANDLSQPVDLLVQLLEYPNAIGFDEYSHVNLYPLTVLAFSL